MDLSKLPRLSETDKHTPPPPPPQPEAAPRPAVHQYGVKAPESSAAEAWIGIAIGLLIQLISTRFWSFLGSKLFGSQFTWTFSDANGTPITYPQSVFFMGDLALVLFGLVLVVEGIVMAASRNARLIFGAFALTSVATLFNLIYLIQMMSGGYGLQLYAAVAVIFGVYVAIHQWQLFQMHRGMSA